MPRSTHETRFLLTAKDQTRRAFRSARTGMAGVKSAVTGLHSSVLALAGIGGLGFLTKGLVDTNAEFQTLKSSLKTVTGSAEAADKAFDLIENFAVTTPFALQEVTSAFIKLKALGLDPSEAAINSYGNTASAMGKSLDQMIEAVADAATGEFERLKEFGIRAKKQGEEIEFTFQGVTTTVGRSAAEITGYLQSIGNVQFAGAMEDQMNNLTPALSNFNAAVDGLFVKVGEAGFNDVFAGLTRDLTDFITSLDDQAIEDFTQSVIGNFADFIDQIDFVVDSIARTTQILNGALPGAGDIRPGSDGYRLGDFNNSQQRNQGGLRVDELRQALIDRGLVGDETAQRELSEQTGVLREISDRIREQSAGAIAG